MRIIPITIFITVFCMGTFLVTSHALEQQKINYLAELERRDKALAVHAQVLEGMALYFEDLQKKKLLPKPSNKKVDDRKD